MHARGRILDFHSKEINSKGFQLTFEMDPEIYKKIIYLFPLFLR